MNDRDNLLGWVTINRPGALLSLFDQQHNDIDKHGSDVRGAS